MKNTLKFSVVLLTAALLPRFACADLVGNYTPDANTLVLLHFDEAAGGSVTTNVGSLAGNFYAVANSTSGNGLAVPPPVTTMLGAAGYVNGATNFNNCLTNPTAGYLAGFDYNKNNQYDGDVSSSSLSADRLNMSVLNIGNGGNTPFTLEALIRPTTISGVNQEILCTDSDASNRGFQFRIASAGSLQFSFIYGSQAVSGVIPTTGPDAFVAGNWYHVAVTYDGTTATLYWTKLDPSNGAAHVLTTASLNLPASDGTVQGPLVVGNENRNSSTEQFLGSIDEVRISNVARGSGQMQFYSPQVTITANPVSQNVDYNQPVNFSVGASSSFALGYQWRFNSNAIAGATSPTYTITNVAASNAGYYDCVVTNSGGYSAISSEGKLVVGAANFLANRYSFTADTSDSIGGQWGTNFGNAYVANGALVLDGTTGTYMQLPAGLFNGTNATALTVEFWATYGSNPNNVYPFAFGYTNYIIGSGIVGINFAMYNARSTGGQTVSASPADPSFAQSATTAGSFDGQTVHVACVFDPPNKTMAIYTNGVLAAANTNFSVNISSLNDQLSFIGRSLWASDPYLNASIDEIRIFKGALSSISIKQSQDQGPNTLLADGPAQFVLQPVNTSVPVGQPATFTVAAVGYLPITYQWFRNGALIPGATNVSYSLIGQLADNGATFSCNATNTIGVTTYVTSSATVTLNVFLPPTLAWLDFAHGGSGDGLWNTTSLNWTNDGVAGPIAYTQTNAVLLDDRGSGSPSLDVQQSTVPYKLTFNSSANYSIISSSGSGSLTGLGSITKSGAGTLMIDVTNTMSGPVTISAGTLQLGNYDALGSLGSGVVTNNATLAIVRGDTALNIANAIHGTGALNVNGSGSVTLSGNNDYSGATLVNAGILYLGSSNGLGSASGGTTVASGAQLYVNANVDVAEPLSLNGVGDGNGALRKGGGGSTTWSGAINLAADASLGVDGGATLNLSNAISGAAALSAVGSVSGTLTLSANNTFSGGFILNGPIINLNAGGALGSGAVTVNGSGRFLLKDGLNITNSFVANTVNPGVATGFLMVNDNTNGTITTVSGPLTFGTAPISGGNFAGPTSSGYLNVLGFVSAPGLVTGVRLGNVRLSGGGDYSEIQVRANTTSIGADNGVATNAVMDIGGNGSPTAPTFFDLNGFNQKLAGLKNTVTPANLGMVTNNSSTLKTLTLDLLGNSYVFDGAVVGKISLVLNSGVQNFTGLLATNAYTGDTTVNGGTLELGVPSLYANSTVTLASGAFLQLDFATTNQIGALVLNGVSQSPGVYNTTTSPSYITGSGSLLVVPPPLVNTNPTNLTATVSGGNLILSWPPDHIGWTLQVQTNSLATGLGTNWVDMPNSTTVNSVTNTINPANGSVYYRMKY